MTGWNAEKNQFPASSPPLDRRQYVIAPHRICSARQPDLNLQLAVRTNLEHSSRHQRLGDSTGIVPGTDFRLPYFGKDEILGATVKSRTSKASPIYCRPQRIIIVILLCVTPAGEPAFSMQFNKTSHRRNPGRCLCRTRAAPAVKPILEASCSGVRGFTSRPRRAPWQVQERKR